LLGFSSELRLPLSGFFSSSTSLASLKLQDNSACAEFIILTYEPNTLIDDFHADCNILGVAVIVCNKRNVREGV